MSSKHQRYSPSPSPSPSPSTNPATSKFPKFLQKQTSRDRSRSVTEPAGIPTNLASSTISASPSPELPQSSIPIPKTRKFLGIKEKEKTSSGTPPSAPDVDDAPVIVEPVAIPRPRTRSERPAASAPDSSSQLYSSTSSTSRIGDLPTRLSGWFSHTFSSSSTDLPTLLAYHSTASPKGKGPSALLTAAKNGKGHLDKAMRYLLDSDAMPDKCADPIWLLGVQHQGYEPPLPALPNVVATSPSSNNINSGPGAFALAFRRNSASPPSFRSSTSSVASSELSQSTNSSSSKIPNPAANWPPVFYIDFTSRIWLTYRSQFPIPIKDGRLGDLCDDPNNGELEEGLSAASSPTIVKSRPWNWAAVVGGEKTWTSDSGWGCMLRTGQSLLANALIHMHLGRDWRRPPYPVHTADYATYVQILTWFLDTPVREAPFSVHRMALAGKELGTDVGQWFGPSVAAGAIKTLVTSFLECGLAVAVASDSTLYQTHVFAASHGDMDVRSRRRPTGITSTTWGDRPVLLLLGIRLGIEGVNPIYYDTIKLLYTFPQSVGIAGGRPSSSYYFVGSQADNLFYLDPHNPRPAIPLRPLPADVMAGTADPDAQREMGAASDSEREQDPSRPQPQYRKQQQQQQRPQRAPASPSSTRTGSSNFSYHAPVSPSPLQHQFSNTTATTGSSSSSGGYDHSYNNSYPYSPHSRSPPPSYHKQSDGRWRRSASTSAGSGSHHPGVEVMDPRELGVLTRGDGDGDSVPNDSVRRGLDPVQLHYCTAYSAAELKTFHCERVRKMPMSGLDPSMLIGFLCRDEKDWWDFRKRVTDLPRTIFSVQDEQPTWPCDSDDNMGLESISEPDDMDLNDDDDDDEDLAVDDEDEEEEEEEEEEGEVVELEEGGGAGGGQEEVDSEKFSSRSASTSSASAGGSTRHRHHRHRSPKSDEVDTDEDPVDPVTPGPNSRFDIVVAPQSRKGGREEERDDDVDEYHEFEDEDGDDDDDIEDDWVDPSLPSPTPTSRPRPFPQSPQQQQPPPVPIKDHVSHPSHSSSSSSSTPAAAAAPLSKTKSSSSKKSSSTSNKTTTTKKSSKKQIPVPVPLVKLPTQQQQPQEHFPFPVAPIDDPSASPPFRGKGSTTTTTEKRMHTARARHGGRTQSGGVKGILPDD